MQMKRTRFLPKAVTAEIKRLPWRVFGAACLVAACFAWLALMSWSFGDPSPNNATSLRPSNWLGGTGASLAEALLQAFGLAAPLLVLPLAGLGLQHMAGAIPIRFRARILYWAAAIVAAPAFASSFPPPSRWPLNHGLGGIVGDALANGIAAITAPIPWLIRAPLSILVAGGLAAFFLAKASGTKLSDLLAAIPKSGAPKSEPAEDRFEDQPSVTEVLLRRLTSVAYRKRVPVLVSAPAKKPKEFWMASAEAKLAPAPKVAGKTRAPAAVAEPAARASSPLSYFSFWGARGDADENEGGEEREPLSEEDILSDSRIEPFFGARPASFRASHSPEPDARSEEEDADFPNAEPAAKRSFVARLRAERRGRLAPSTRQDYRDEETVQLDEPEAASFSASLPPLNLLKAPARGGGKPDPNDPKLITRAKALMEVLGDFGVKGQISGIYPGPVITLFELEPARGTKSSRVVGLADDIARSMSAVSARVAVVPGRDAIGIELPNPIRESVSLRELLEADAFQAGSGALPLALGKSIGGEPIIVDLARMPHLLIAGTTGSGKSVAINTMILSLLYRLPASQCNFIMIDPKMLELSAYQGIPHLLAPVVTDPKKAVNALKWVVREMNSRYERMSRLGVRNIASYNASVATAQLRGRPLKRTVQTGFDPRTGEPIVEEETFEAVSMPYIVVVIDEMADLMMVAGKEIEFAVQRLSQMARAAGIHLIMATQRPSVDVVTGTIKANFPSRISFQVTSKIDSRTIIGEQGAEQLLGAGDMLYMAAGGRIVRAHGPFVSDGEVEAVADHLRAQGFPTYRDDILEGEEEAEDQPADNGGDAGGDLYARAVDVVLKDRKPTTSYLQRRLNIGYNRAASLIERMEEEGIVSPPNRMGRREILIAP